jgi:hypothetical protein
MLEIFFLLFFHLNRKSCSIYVSELDCSVVVQWSCFKIFWIGWNESRLFAVVVLSNQVYTRYDEDENVVIFSIKVKWRIFSPLRIHQCWNRNANNCIYILKILSLTQRSDYFDCKVTKEMNCCRFSIYLIIRLMNCPMITKSPHSPPSIRTIFHVTGLINIEWPIWQLLRHGDNFSTSNFKLSIWLTEIDISHSQLSRAWFGEKAAQ